MYRITIIIIIVTIWVWNSVSDIRHEQTLGAFGKLNDLYSSRNIIITRVVNKRKCGGRDM